MTRVSLLRHRLEIQADRGVTRDAHGAIAEDWQCEASVWGQVTPRGGNEAFESLGLKAETTHTVRMRYRRGITSKHRIIHRHENTDRVLNILAIHNEEERDRFLMIECVEVAE